jgi:hypothetical protein
MPAIQRRAVHASSRCAEHTRRIEPRALRVVIDAQPNGPHERHRIALLHHTRPHAVVEDHLAVFEMIYEVYVAEVSDVTGLRSH